MFKYTKQLLQRFKSWTDYNPPGAMTSKGWRLFEKEFKEVAPIRFWFKNTLYRSYILPIKWKYDDVSSWIRYRTYDKYHIIDTGLSPAYYEIETLMLNGNFNMLKDFVEVEQAIHSYWWSDDSKNASWCEKHMPFYRKFYPFRRPDLGIKHLDWAATLDDPALPIYERSDSQAQSAREIKALYIWWVEERPARKSLDIPDYDKQGMSDLGFLDDDFDQNAPDYKAHSAAYAAQEVLEEKWKQEDEEMLIRLMKIRRSLWT